MKEQGGNIIFQKSELFVVYQPIFNLQNNKVLGREVLIRSSHATPDELFRISEKRKIILLDRFSRRSSILNFNSTDEKLFINCHPITLCFDEELQRDLENYPNAKQIVLEVTEQNISMDNLIKKLMNLRRTGIKIAVDDFGSGFSNLLRVGEVAPEYIKLDRSFIKKIVQNKRMQNLLVQIVEISKVLGSRLIVEGIERKEELEIVKNSGVIFGQGYYLAKPSLFINEQKKEKFFY